MPHVIEPSVLTSLVACGKSHLLWDCFCAAVRGQSDLRVVGAFGSVDEIPADLLVGVPAVVLTEVRLCDSLTVHGIETLRQRNPAWRFVYVWPAIDQPAMAARHLFQADGSCTINDSLTACLDVIRQVRAGKRANSPTIQAMLSLDDDSGEAQTRPGGILRNLSHREIEILERIARGDTVKEVARELHLSYKTIDSHKYRIMQKLGVHDRVQITRLAIREGLLTP